MAMTDAAGMRQIALDEYDVLLRDGGIAHVRPLRPARPRALHELVDRSSERSAYLRFFTGGRHRPRLHGPHHRAGYSGHALVALAGPAGRRRRVHPRRGGQRRPGDPDRRRRTRARARHSAARTCGLGRGRSRSARAGRRRARREPPDDPCPGRPRPGHQRASTAARSRSPSIHGPPRACWRRSSPATTRPSAPHWPGCSTPLRRGDRRRPRPVRRGTPDLRNLFEAASPGRLPGEPHTGHLLGLPAYANVGAHPAPWTWRSSRPRPARAGGGPRVRDRGVAGSSC